MSVMNFGISPNTLLTNLRNKLSHIVDQIIWNCAIFIIEERQNVCRILFKIPQLLKGIISFILRWFFIFNHLLHKFIVRRLARLVDDKHLDDRLVVLLYIE
jgi:hypothetical protein